jgi:hypothetical protein
MLLALYLQALLIQVQRLKNEAGQQHRQAPFLADEKQQHFTRFVIYRCSLLHSFAPAP